MASQNWGVLQTTCSCTQLYANCVTPGLSFCRGQQVSEGAAGGGERAPGHPSTHPAEGCDQGQQSGRNAVLVQGGAVLRQGRELLGPAPHSPHPNRHCLSPLSPNLPHQLPRAVLRVRAGHPGTQLQQGCSATPAHKEALRVDRGASARHPARGGTCRQQFIMRTTKSNCWWSSTARFCCACRCSSCARQRRAARPFRALSTAGSSWGKGSAGLTARTGTAPVGHARGRRQEGPRRDPRSGWRGHWGPEPRLSARRPRPRPGRVCRGSGLQ